MAVNESNLEAECRNKNVDSCSVYACLIENLFVLRIFNDYFLGANFDPFFKHSEGWFDPEFDCPHAQIAGSDADKQCCGQYPLRYPYRGDFRGCCGNRTFDTEMFQCCSESEGDKVKTVC